MPTCDSCSDHSSDHVHYVDARDTQWSDESAAALAFQILASSEGLVEDGSHRPADRAFNAWDKHRLAESLAGFRTTRLILGRSPREWLVFRLCGREIARFRLDEGRYVIEASAAVNIDRQVVAADPVSSFPRG